jgi:MFS transporter, SHS family, lactate transporter
MDTPEEDVNNMTAGQKIKNFPRYVQRQIISLKPPGEVPMNPWKCLRLLNRRQWAFFFIGFLGWSWVPIPLFPKLKHKLILRTHSIFSACH